MNEIILVERFSQDSLFWKNLVKKNKISNLSVEEIVNKYRGFEGNRIFFIRDKNDSSSNVSEIVDVNNINHSGFYLISFENNITNESNRKNPRFIGYDFGVCEEGATVYSSIVNEILFGVVDELVQFHYQLNENFLFSDQEALKKFINLHHKLLLEERDVEHDENMKIYEIWQIDFL